MKKNLERGSSTFDGIAILVVLFVIIILSPKSGGGVSYFGSFDGESPLTLSERNSGVAGSQIAADSDIELGSGNASYTDQSFEEYITIENRGVESVDITGWTLKNGKDRRPYNTGGSLQRFSADIAKIPQASLFISPTGANSFQNVVLKEGEKAIVTTGLPAIQAPYRVISFKENKCSGYLEASEYYAFNPPLRQACPTPSDERGIENLDTQCRNFINGLYSCRTPEFDTRLDNNGRVCDNCIDGVHLSSSCIAFIKAHFTYEGCIANHKNDPDFSGDTWRVFLGRGWEMWAEEYESIELFNLAGQLVDYENY